MVADEIIVIPLVLAVPGKYSNVRVCFSSCLLLSTVMPTFACSHIIDDTLFVRRTYRCVQRKNRGQEREPSLRALGVGGSDIMEHSCIVNNVLRNPSERLLIFGRLARHPVKIVSV